MIRYFIKFILFFLFVFTPIAFGSMDLWAFSLMELGILLIFLLGAFQSLFSPSFSLMSGSASNPERISNLKPIIFSLCFFLSLILFQMIPLPSELIKIMSPKTFTLRQQLLFTGDSLSMIPLSFVPFLTQIEFFKWFTLTGFFIFLLKSNLLDRKLIAHLSLIIMLIGIFESLYGIFEFFSGRRHILFLNGSPWVSSVTGTFINRNYFGGYLLMVIPLSMGFLFSQESFQRIRFMGLRHRIPSLDGTTLLISFGIIVMILALLFSASRMGIMSLLLSFSLISFLFKESQKEKRFSKTPILILGLAILWAAWIGLDAVIGRFFNVSESFEERWKVWVDTFQIFKDFPMFGSGLGTFAQIFPMYRSFHVRGLYSHAENDFLQLASEVGITGISILLFLFFYLFYNAVLKIRSIPRRNLERYIGIGGLVGILALMLHSFVERNIQVPANALLYTLIWAIVLKISHLKGKKDFLQREIAP